MAHEDRPFLTGSKLDITYNETRCLRQIPTELVNILEPRVGTLFEKFENEYTQRKLIKLARALYDRSKCEIFLEIARFAHLNSTITILSAEHRRKMQAANENFKISDIFTTRMQLMEHLIEEVWHSPVIPPSLRPDSREYKPPCPLVTTDDELPRPIVKLPINT